ncbi:cytochrome D1 domain-containing protein [Terriglobus tenax]|uniref:cytochrome D1 domain-containing protein n=1 Tax=Terriglobus tenax TaxID=1111115 RepID=UPI0021E0CB3B|nr:cytochrome D1 domain-containing protein [Terriglobus tenax]
MKIALAATLFATSALAQSTLLVTNQTDRSLAYIDTATGKVTDTIPENGVTGHEITTSPDGKLAYIPMYGNAGVGKPGTDGSTIQVVDIASHKIVHTIDLGHGVRPHKPVYDTHRNVLWVSTELDHSITAIDPKSYKVLYSVPTGQAESHMFVLSPDGKRAYTANVGPGTVSVLDLDAKKLVTIIPISKNTQRITITSDGKYVFTSDQESPRLAVIDTATNKVKEYVPLPSEGYGGAITADGKTLLLCQVHANKLVFLDLPTMKVTKTIAVGEYPQAVVIDRDGKHAYVSSLRSGTIDVIDMATREPVKSIFAGKGADGMVLVSAK